MSKRNIIVSIASISIIVLLGVISGGAYLLGDKHGANSMTIRQTTPHELAEAMKADSFYANYRENTLAVTGTVASTSNNANGTTVGFVSDSSYHVTCSFARAPLNVVAGDTLKVITEGHSAVRESNGVMLQCCITL